MKQSLKRITLAVFLVALLCFTPIYLINGYSPYANWVSTYKKADGTEIILRMILSDEGQSMAKLQTRHRKSTIYYLCSSGNGKFLNIYESDRKYSYQGPLFAVASIVGFGKLVVRFSQAQKFGLPERATFKKVKH